MIFMISDLRNTWIKDFNGFPRKLWKNLADGIDVEICWYDLHDHAATLKTPRLGIFADFSVSCEKILADGMNVEISCYDVRD